MKRQHLEITDFESQEWEREATGVSYRKKLFTYLKK